MKREAEAVPDWQLERWRLGELPPDEAEALARAAAGACAVRGVGALWGLEFASAAAARQAAAAARAAGVLVLAGGAAGRVVQVAPPLVIAELQLERALAVLAAACAAPAQRPG